MAPSTRAPEKTQGRLPGFVAAEAQALTRTHLKPTLPAPQQQRKAVLCILASSGLFMLMYALTQQLGGRYPLGEVICARGLFALIPLIPIVYRDGVVETLKTEYPFKHLFRCGLGLVSMFTCFGAITMMPLTQATSLFYTAPIITTLLAVPVLKERVTSQKLVAVCVGFAGVLLMLQPQGGSISAGVAVALFSAVAQALVAIELRSMGRTERSTTIVIYFLLTCTIAGGLTMLGHAVMPDAKDALIMLALGFVGGIGQIFMTDAYRNAPASLVSPLGYSGLVWALIFDICMFGKVPSAVTLGGVVTIAAAGIFLVMQKSKD